MAKENQLPPPSRHIRDFPTFLNLGPWLLVLGKIVCKSTKLGISEQVTDIYPSFKNLILPSLYLIKLESDY